MAFKKTPSYLWQGRTGAWFFKLGIPAPLRKHYLDAVTGKPKAHIVQSLGTHKHADAEKLKGPLLAHYRAEFRGYSSGVVTKEINPGQLLVPLLREEVRQLRPQDGDLRLALTDAVEQAYKQIKRDEGPEAATVALRRMVHPDKTSIKEALELLIAASPNKGQTVETYRLACRELLEFLKVADCLPDGVTEKKAVAYVDSLNAAEMSLSVKKKRLGGLNQLWRHMRHRGWPTSPWKDHELTDARKARNVPTSKDGEGADEEGSEDVRPFTDEEVIKVFELPTPEDKRQRTYTRPLFRELYALGFITGMRLNEIASLRPMDITALEEGWLLVSIPKTVAKTEAGTRKLPVCHPVAVAILNARVANQKNPKRRIFSECSLGGHDQKPSWHVSKAMSRERITRLEFTREVNFHSTRRSFATLLEQAQKGDTLAQQRYMGHDIPTMMHRVYSGGAGNEKLKQVVAKLRYSQPVERALKLAEPVAVNLP